ncbi:MAG: phosphoglucosamine mutase [Lentisphaerae bacterium]|nr:phosphoglucosamine mutase [Lentisphaerota bacterium]
MGRLFGTDGIRGVANRPPMTAEDAMVVGRACVWHMKTLTDVPLIVIGRDTRQSSPMLEAAVAAGVASAGGEAVTVGVVPTPCLAHIADRFDAHIGIMISASHNPFEDNGIKLFGPNGTKLPDSAEAAIESLVLAPDRRQMPVGKGVGWVRRDEDAAEDYLQFLISHSPCSAVARMKVVLDCANGAASELAPSLFRALHARVKAINILPNGVNINDNCGSQHPGALREAVLKEKADVGFAFDGDADRVIAVDETGRVLQGDEMVAACAAWMKAGGTLRNGVVVTTVMSNFGLGRALAGLGIRHETAAVGDRNVLVKMDEEGASLGGEDSGHIIFRDIRATGDGMLAALQFLAACDGLGLPVSKAASIMLRSPQKIINVPVSRKPPLESLAGVCAAIESAEKELGAEGRVLVRHSGTQQMCRVMVEGPTDDLTGRLCRAIADAVKTAIG